MEKNKTALEKILMVLAIFRLEKGHWPMDAAGLQAFAGELGNPLDFSKYHRFRFLPRSREELTLDFCLLPLNQEWALGGQAGVRISGEPAGDGSTLPLEVKLEDLSIQRVESKTFCWTGEKALTAKRSA